MTEAEPRKAEALVELAVPDQVDSSAFKRPACLPIVAELIVDRSETQVRALTWSAYVRLNFAEPKGLRTGLDRAVEPALAEKGIGQSGRDPAPTRVVAQGGGEFLRDT